MFYGEDSADKHHLYVQPDPFLHNVAVVVVGSAWEAGLAEEVGIVLVCCSDFTQDVFSCCKRLKCVLIARAALIDGLDPSQFADLASFGQSVQVLVMVQDDAPQNVKYLLRLGCMGALRERSSLSTLRRAVRAVAKDPPRSETRHAGSLTIHRRPQTESPHKLTRREEEILQLIGRGYKHREIADELFISCETVRWHKRSLYAKIGGRGRLRVAFRAQVAMEPTVR